MALRNAMWLENAGPVYHAGDYRRLLEALVSGPGVARAGDLAVAQQSPVAMGVSVARGTGFVAGSESTNQGIYAVSNDAPVNVGIAAAHASLGRIDLVCLRVRDDEFSGTSHVADLFVVTGTPSASPAAPTAPANSLVLAQVTVAAAVGSITTAAITDLRTGTGGATTPRLLLSGSATPNSGVSTPITWSAATDNTGMMPATPATFATVPATGAGGYLITFKVASSNGSGIAGLRLEINAAGITYYAPTPASAFSTTFTLVVPLGAGAQISANVFHTDGAARAVTAVLHAYRVAV